MDMPFHFGEILAPHLMVDRETEVADVSRAMIWGERLFVIGPRRFGKSTILRAASAVAEASGTPVLSVNAERYADLSEMASDLITQAAAVQRVDPKAMAKRVTEFFGRFRPQVGYDVITNAWSVSIIPDEHVPASKTIAQVLDEINVLAGRLKLRIAVVIDEFQALSHLEGLEAEARLRSVIQTHDHLSYVFSGSDTAIMMKMVSDHARPFYRLGRNLYIKEVPRVDFRTFLHQQLATAYRETTDDGVEALLRAANDVPYSVQQLGLFCWTVGSAAKAEAVFDETFFDSAFAEFLSREGVTYRSLYNSLPRQQARAVKAIADTQAIRPSTLKQLAQSASMPVTSFRSARDGLLKKALLREDIYANAAEQANYVFIDPFFAAWLRVAIVKR